MTVDDIIDIAKLVQHAHAGNTIGHLATAVLDLLAEDAPCGWENPSVRTDSDAMLWICVPDWRGFAGPDDVRAMARMLLRAADECDVKRAADEADAKGKL